MIARWIKLLCAKYPSGVAVIPYTWKAHMLHSGYGQLTRFLDADLKTSLYPIPSRLAVFVAPRLPGRLTATGIQVGLVCKLKKIRTLLIISAEGNGSAIYAIKRLSPTTRVIATFHSVPDGIGRMDMKQAPFDDAIAVATNQIPALHRLLPNAQIHFLPHGVDADYFCPGHYARENFCLCVGAYLRDFETLNRIADILSEQQPRVRVVLICQKARLAGVTMSPHVEQVLDCTDEQLLQFYQRASILLLPLLDCTANNVLLEGLACGLPAVTTKVGGTRDYTTEQCSILCAKGDAIEHANAVMEIWRSPSRLYQMQRAAREHANLFNWPRMQQQLCNLIKL
jgi:glycosyltransferase involved in cell wall biosynthesis